MTDQFVAGKFADLEPNDLTFTPATNDPALQTIDAQRLQSSSARLIWQASPRNKFSAYWDNTRIVRPNMSVATSPVWVEESAIDGDTPTNTYLATWTSPLTTRLLLEAGFSHVPTSNRWNSDERVERTLPSALLIDRGVFIRGIGVLPTGGEGAHTRILNSYRNAYRASLSYVTGSHALKVGFRAEQARSINRTADNPSQFLATWSDTLRPFFPGIAIFQANNTAVTTDATPNLGIYVQDQWTRNRLTVNAGVRFDHQRAGYPDQTIPVSRYRAEPFYVEGATPISFSDLQPRLGVAYDLFGDGRTAVKVTANRYAEQFGTAILTDSHPGDSPDMRRVWLDFNGDGVVQGDPLNVGANGELILSDGDPNFGLPVQTTFVDPDWAEGWGTRGANWEYSAGVQHEVRPNVSVNASYFYRTFVNFSVANDLNLTSDDFTEFTVFVPEGPEFPNGGGYSVSGFYDRNPDSLGRPAITETTSANRFGGREQRWRGIDLTVNARQDDLLLQGGISTGSTSHDRCTLLVAVPESVGQNLNPDGFCDTSTLWLTQVKLLGSYTLPYGLQLSGAFQSIPGFEREARWAFDASATDLGRPFTLGTTARHILEPGTEYGDLANLLDVRLTKLFDVGATTRIRAMFDVYNVFNNNAVTSEGNTIGSNYRVPDVIIPGRLAKFAVQFDF